MPKCYVLLREFMDYDIHETLIVKVYSDEDKAKAHLSALDAILSAMYTERRASYNSIYIIDRYTNLLSDSKFAGPSVLITKFCEPSYRLEECEIE